MDLSFCILTRSQPELLPRCVASCAREIELAAVNGEILLVDNASTDGTPQRVANQFPGVRRIRNEQNLSFSAGYNQGIRASLGRAIVILNDDAIMNSGSLRVMLEKLYSDSVVGVVGPRLLNPDGSHQRGYTNRRFPRLRSLACGILGLTPRLERYPWARDLLTHTRDPERSGDTEHLAGACLVARREALESVGLFDEAYHFWMEDVDLCYRLKKRGWKIVYLAEALVTHYGSASLKQLLGSQRRMNAARGLIHYYRRHKNPLIYWILKFSVGVALLAQTPLFVWSAVEKQRLQPKEWMGAAKASLRDLRVMLWG
jgi:N-acetylglucosaminyl-diphospho-decaprenol L-rhamnosyltransferase